jgi:glycosyltransferase involved in cell wall biosynthesis
MKILFISHYQDMYGANRSLCNLIVGLKEHQPLVLCPSKGDLTNFLNSYQIENLSNLYYRGWEYKNVKELIKLPYRIIRSLITLIKILPTLKSFDPDVIYSNSSVIWYGKIISLLLKKPHVWHIREFGKQDYNLNMLGGKKLRNYLMNSSEAIIAISKAIDKEVLNKINPLIKHQIYNGVINSNEIGSKRERKENEPFTFCMAGLLIANKGYEEGIRAFEIVFKNYPQSKLLIAGQGMEGDNYDVYLKNLVKKLNLSKSIEFLGYLGDVKELYNRSHCLLMCSRAEALGRVTIEAMANGLPVIGYKGGGTVEIIEDGYNGFLYEIDHHHLSEKMLHIINCDFYKDLSLNAIFTVKTKFTIEKYIDNINLVLKNVHSDFERTNKDKTLVNIPA